MKSRTISLAVVVLLAGALTISVLPSPGKMANAAIIEANHEQSASLPIAAVVEGPYVSLPVTPGVSPEVRSLRAFAPGERLAPFQESNRRKAWNRLPASRVEQTVGRDPLLDKKPSEILVTPEPLISFEGIEHTGAVPPDTNGDVGPNHYVQMVNVHFAIYDKSGNLLAGPTPINELWNGQGNQCEFNNDGDPIVLYDPLADRWLLSQFALSFPYHMCIAISQTPDPLGAYHLYQFTVPDFPDYPKFGVWPDAYYMATNESNAAAYAYNRTQMLQGLPATFQRFTTNGNFMLPSDLDGFAPPPEGAPNYFYTLMDDTFWGGGPDRLEVWEFHVDFDTPGNSSFTLAATLPTTPFIYTVCGWFVFPCIPQPSPGELVDAISEWPMFRLAYRNFGTHEALVGNFAFDLDNTNRSAIRWFELRNTDGGGWTLYQEGTHAPDQHHRWIGSIAMDKRGNIALGYSVSSNTQKPAIRYAIRLASDPLGTLQPEATMISGDGVQTNGFNRWGDYSALSVDPVDDCTFWYTNEYYPVNAPSSWHTRIGAFIIPSCTSPDLSIVKSASESTPLPGEVITFTVSVANSGGITATNGLVSDTMPAGVTFGGPITLEPPDAGVPGMAPPLLASDLAIGPGRSITVTFPVTVGFGLMDGTVITNTASITSTEVITPIKGSAWFTVTYEADLSMTKTASPEPVVIHQELAYLLTVTNQSLLTATQVIVTDTLPAEGVLFGSADPARGSCSLSGNQVVCDLGDIFPGEWLTATILITPTQTGVLTNSAVVAAQTLDPFLENNSQAIHSTIIASADVEVAKAAFPDPVTAGEILTYTLTITNIGPSPATGILLTDTLPLSVTFTTASPGCTTALSEVVCLADELAVGASTTFTIHVTVDAAAQDLLTNTAIVVSDVYDPDLANNVVEVDSAVSPRRWLFWLPVITR